MRELQRRHNMMTLLVDEHGVVSGLITFENVIEELVGQIQDEFDSESPLIVEMSPNVYEIDAACGVDAVQRRLAVELPEISADTIGGVVIEAFGRIPKSGETVAIGRYSATVLAADARHVQKIRFEKT
jgi:Mg2+/Co2+ transporter CorC